MEKKVYFAGSIRGGREDAAVYETYYRLYQCDGYGVDGAYRD